MKELEKLLNSIIDCLYSAYSFQNISTEKNELFAILDYRGYACYVKRGVTLIFYFESKRSIWVQNFVSGCCLKFRND
jgi:hypothetical protein